MAKKQDHQEEIQIHDIEIFKNEENISLGSGSYGTVYRAKYIKLICAAKCLHPSSLQSNAPNRDKVLEKFEHECHFLSQMRHPNIVQYLGFTKDPNTNWPILLMELMKENLGKFLQRQTGPLPYHVEVSLSQDIALALAYLHAKGIVHRDLSCNNVLLTAGLRAKVVDFGMSRLIDPDTTPLTRCPGTPAYMAPEALTGGLKYSEKLDCFSWGVLCIQIMTRRVPKPLKTFLRHIVDLRGVMYRPVPEEERRQNDIAYTDPDHTLRPIALQCLVDNAEERPAAQDLCQQLTNLKEEPKYKKSLQKEAENQQLLQAQDHQLKTKDGIIATKEKEIQQLKQDLQKANQQLHVKSAKHPIPKPHARDRSIQLKWQVCKKAPRAMYAGSAAAKGCIAYFRPAKSQSVLSYHTENEEWSELPPFSNRRRRFSLVVVKGYVTAVGGMIRGTATNTLINLTEEERGAHWVEHFPPMDTARWFCSVAFDGRHLTVAGGANEGGRLSSVEVMDTDCENYQWYTASNLPQPYEELVTAIAKGKLYLLGGMDERGIVTQSVLTCSISDLLQSCRPPIHEQTYSKPKQEMQPLHQPQPSCEQLTVWREVASVPAYLSSCASIGGKVVTCGGYYLDQSTRRQTSEVFTYDPETDSWQVVIDCMPTARSFTMVVVLPHEKLLVVGGNVDGQFSASETSAVEMAVFAEM